MRACAGSLMKASYATLLIGMGIRIALCIALVGLSGYAQAGPVACGELGSLEPDAFSHLTLRLQAQRQAGGTADIERLSACGLDEEMLRQRQCSKAYDQQNLEFLLRHCQYEAWSLARAQCERNLDSISPRYAAFCRAFGRE